MNLKYVLLVSGLVYHTWVERVWPEIRVPLTEEEEEEKAKRSQGSSPIDHRCMTAGQMEAGAERLREAAAGWLRAAWAERSAAPAVFCARVSLD